MITGRLLRRGSDIWGCGDFGARRANGKRVHKGEDFLAFVGMDVLAPVDGKVTKLGYPYSDDLTFRYVEISLGNGLKVQVYYISPMVQVGDYVVKNSTVIGTVQDLTKRYSADKNHKTPIPSHVHVQVLDIKSNPLDPKEIL